MQKDYFPTGQLNQLQLAALVSGLGEGMFVYSSEGRPLYYNEVAKGEAYGYLHPPLEPPGSFGAAQGLELAPRSVQSGFELLTVAGEVLPYASWPLERLLRGEPFSELEVRVSSPSSERAIHALSGWNVVRADLGNPELDSLKPNSLKPNSVEAGGGPLAVLSVRDVTQHREAEERFSVCFDSSPVGATVTRLSDLSFTSVNGAFAELTGYPREELVGRTPEALSLFTGTELSGSHVDTESGKLAAKGPDTAHLRRSEEVGELELALRTKAGGVRHVLVTEKPIELGGEASLLGSWVDISERKRTEDLLTRALREVMQDAAWFSAQVMERLAQLRVDGTERTDFTELTRREQQILGMMAKGHSNERIGAELSLAKQTVRNYVASIYSKLGVHSRAAAVVWARERGLGSF